MCTFLYVCVFVFSCVRKGVMGQPTLQGRVPNTDKQNSKPPKREGIGLHWSVLAHKKKFEG